MIGGKYREERIELRPHHLPAATRAAALPLAGCWLSASQRARLVGTKRWRLMLVESLVRINCTWRQRL